MIDIRFIIPGDLRVSDLEVMQFFSGGGEVWKRQKYSPKEMRVSAKFVLPKPRLGFNDDLRNVRNAGHDGAEDLHSLTLPPDHRTPRKM
jgi:hypothetical protein